MKKKIIDPTPKTPVLKQPGGPMGETCATCYYGEEDPQSAEQVICRRNPPTWHYRTEPGRLKGLMHIIKASEQPSFPLAGWCGEWKVKHVN